MPSVANERTLELLAPSESHEDSLQLVPGRVTCEQIAAASSSTHPGQELVAQFARSILQSSVPGRLLDLRHAG